jgi:hypothetical protein
MPFLTDIPGIRDVTVNGGAALPRRSTLNIIGVGVVATDNPVAGRTDLTLPTSVGGTTITPALLSGNVNNYSPTGHSTAAVERWSSGATPRTVTGLDSVGQDRPMIINVGSSSITLAHESSLSSAANRFECPNAVDYVLTAGSALELVRDPVSARWRVVS